MRPFLSSQNSKLRWRLAHKTHGMEMELFHQEKENFPATAGLLCAHVMTLPQSAGNAWPVKHRVFSLDDGAGRGP